MKRTAYLFGAISGFLAVALGAFGAHAWEEILLENGYTDTFETGSRYHLIHSVLLIGMGLIAERGESKWLRIGIIACIIGVTIFAGTLYLLSTLNIPILGAITPVGGLGMLTAWACIFMHFLNRNNNNSTS